MTSKYTAWSVATTALFFISIAIIVKVIAYFHLLELTDEDTNPINPTQWVGLGSAIFILFGIFVAIQFYTCKPKGSK